MTRFGGGLSTASQLKAKSFGGLTEIVIVLTQGLVRVMLTFCLAMACHAAAPSWQVWMSCAAINVPGTLQWLTAPGKPLLEPAQVAV